MNGLKQRFSSPCDAAIARLSDDERTLVAGVWEARSRAEGEAGAIFVLVSARAAAACLPGELLRRLERATNDERRHAEVCRQVASAYRGAEVGSTSLAPIVEPDYAGASAAMRARLHIVSQCAINETIAGAFLELALGGATHELPRAALRELLTDEVEHGRIGWALLAASDETTRGTIAPWLIPLLAANLRTWRETARRPDARPAIGLPAHGCPSAAAIDSAVLGAVRNLVLPGFAHVGFDVTEPNAWFARQAADTNTG